MPIEAGARPPSGVLLAQVAAQLHPAAAPAAVARRAQADGTLLPRDWVRPAGMLSPRTQLAGFVASSKIERPPTTLTSPPPHCTSV